MEPDEGRNAEVAREMLESGDWITPRYNALTYLDKPVIYFWLVAASFRVWGVSEWAARFPSAVMALATMLLVWFLARRMFGGAAGLRAGIVFATSPLVIGLARFVIFDMTLAFLVTAAMVSFWLATEENYRRPWLDALLFAAMGIATITKGPVGFLLPLISILTFQAARGRFGELKRLRWGLGLAVFFAATLPWFITVSLRHPAFPGYALWQESLQRFATGSARRGGSFLYYVPVFLAGVMPWSFFLLFSGLNRIRRWRELRQAAHKSTLFLLVWALVVFAFFTISRSKLPGYFLPAIVPLAILMARAWAEVGSREEGRGPDWLTAGFAALIGVGLLLAAAPQALRLPGVEARLAEKTSPAVVAILGPSVLYSGLILMALGVAGRNLAARRRAEVLAVSTFVVAAVTLPLLALRLGAPLKTYADAFSSRRLAQTILASPERDLPIYSFYCFRTGLGFYLRRPVGLVTADAGEMTSNYVSYRLQELGARDLAGNPRARAELGPDAGRLLVDTQTLRARAASEPILILVRNHLVGALFETVPQVEPLWSDWRYSVWKAPGRKGTGNGGRE